MVAWNIRELKVNHIRISITKLKKNTNRCKSTQMKFYKKRTDAFSISVQRYKYYIHKTKLLWQKNKNNEIIFNHSIVIKLTLTPKLKPISSC